MLKSRNAGLQLCSTVTRSTISTASPRHDADGTRYRRSACRSAVADPRRLSRENFANDVTADIGEPELPALEEIRQLLVIDPEEMQDGCLEVVNMGSTFHDIKTIVVRTSMHVSRLDTAATHPKRKDTAMMIAAVVIRFR